MNAPQLGPGEPAPWFKAPSASTPELVFDTAGGRYVLMLFLPVAAEPRKAALTALAAGQRLFDDAKLAAFVVVREAETAAQVRDLRGLRWILDESREVSRLYGADDRGFWLLLDPALRVMRRAGIDDAEALFPSLAALPAPGDHAGVPLHAPVLIAPRIFEPELCGELIALHAARGGGEFTGVMRDQGEVTVLVMDALKRRRDVLVEDEALKDAVAERLQRRLFPFIARAFATEVTRIERYLISCYDAEDGGVFHPHRDNVTFQTAHRKFACSINLNEDFDGGDLRFPEFGPATYRPPVGGAVVFACGLMHEAMRVTRGRRFAFLPFLFDEAGAEIREAYRRRAPRTGG